jgi:hypothetical protein
MMKRSAFFSFVVALMFALSFGGLSTGIAAEHPGKSTLEHPGKAITSDSVKKAVKDYVSAQTKAGGGLYVVKDPVLKKDWLLKLDKIHDPVREFGRDGKTIYFACSDFKTEDGKDVLDIDLWMVETGGKLEVTDTKIHKLNGVPRYTYEGTTLKSVK